MLLRSDSIFILSIRSPMPVVCWFARPNCAAFFIHAQRLTYATLTALTCLVSDQCREIDKGLSETQQLGNLSLAFLVLPVSGLSTEVFRYVAQKKLPFFLRNICLHCMIRMDVCVYVCKNAFDSINICTISMHAFWSVDAIWIGWMSARMNGAR